MKLKRPIVTILCKSLTSTTDENIPISMHSTNDDVKFIIVCSSEKSNLDFNIPLICSTIYIHLKYRPKFDKQKLICWISLC